MKSMTRHRLDEPSSYAQIAKRFELNPGDIFISDVTRELNAARQAGMQTRLYIRPGNPAQAAQFHRTISTFDQI